MWKPVPETGRRLSRRTFLRRGALLAGGVALLGSRGLSSLAGASQAPAPKPIKPIDALPWQQLREALAGSVLRPGESGYAAAAAPWNRRYAAELPGGIARCRCVEHVQAALLWARVNQVPVALRAGGLSQAGHSNTRGLMIDVSLMNQVEVQPETGLLTAQAGARHRALFEAMRPASVAITHGRCPELGIAGMVLGGGLGFNMRAHGLTCDQLVEVEAVGPSGQVLRANRDSNQELFWALRGGGGGNFAVCTSFSFRTFPVSDLTVFRLIWTREIDDVLPTLLSILPEAGPDLGCQLTVTATSAGMLSLELQGQTLDSPDELLGLLDPAYQLAAPRSERVERLPYWDGQEILLERGRPECFQERSRYLYSACPIAASDLVLKELRGWPGTGGTAEWKVQLTGGAVDQVGRRSTAYVHRGALMLSSLRMTWKPQESDERLRANQAWLDNLHESLTPLTSSECYQNYADPNEKDFARAYYGENLTYLSLLKRRLDPDGVFEFAQAVPS